MTALVALLVTGGSWTASNAAYKATSWYKERPAISGAKDKEDNQPEYDCPHRVAMLVWLVHNGHTAWMWTTGAWLAILINSKVKSKDAYFIPEENYIGEEIQPETATACDYVWDMSSINQRMLFSPGFRWYPISE